MRLRSARRIVSISSGRRSLAASDAANRLALFGGAALDTDAGPVTGRAAQRHRIALLALLATTRRLYRGRDQLVTLLWPEADTERGRRLLSDSIHRINQALGGDAIVGTGDDVRLNPQHVASDVADFEAAIDAGEWERAVDLYVGPLLDGFFLPGAAEFDQWMESERAQYVRAAAKAIEALAVQAGDAGRLAEAADWWQRLGALVPDDSRVATELMRALESSGNRAGALRHALNHTLLLRETLGVDPDPAVRELADQIARRSDAVVAPPPVRPPALVRTAIAVLPFRRAGESDDDASFADGVTDELTSLLARLPGVRVASRMSSRVYGGATLDARAVAARLEVDWIVGGGVRRSGDAVRIVVQLTDARTGYEVWSESFDRIATDDFTTQKEIAVAIAHSFAPALDVRAGAIPPLDVRAASDVGAVDAYLQARVQWHRRTESGLRHSASLFEKVVAREPGYARAWAGLADAYAVLAFYDHVPPHVAFPRADSAARRAILLDSTLAAPYATLAYVDTYYHWDWTAAEQGFLRALELEPTYSTAHQWYGNLLVARGRFEEAERAMRRAAELDPLSMIAHAAVGWVFVMANQNDRAIRQFRSALQLDPNFQQASYWLGVTLEQNGQASEAIPVLQRLLQGSSDSIIGRAALGRAYAMAGQTGAARAVLDQLLAEESSGHYVSSYGLAKIYQALGDASSALLRLERAYGERAHSMAFLTVDPQLRALAAEPRFQALVERVNQPHHGP